MRKYIVKFLSKFHGRGIKISQINSIRVSKPMAIDSISSVPLARSDVILRAMNHRFFVLSMPLLIVSSCALGVP